MPLLVSAADRGRRSDVHCREGHVTTQGETGVMQPQAEVVRRPPDVEEARKDVP